MNFSTDVIQEVTELNLDIHGGAGAGCARHAEKLVRDGFIWSHLAGDSVQRLKVAQRLAQMAADGALSGLVVHPPAVTRPGLTRGVHLVLKRAFACRDGLPGQARQ